MPWNMSDPPSAHDLAVAALRRAHDEVTALAELTSDVNAAGVLRSIAVRIAEALRGEP